MKVSFITLAVLVAGAVNAQDEVIPAFPEFNKKAKKLYGPLSGYPTRSGLVKIQGAGTKQFKMYPANQQAGTVYRVLPQDNMPCVVPGGENYRMPNLADRKQLSLKPVNPIPNPSAPVEFRK